jgi:YbgC/YbaW family acyl-CoA thioester hydrolase
LHRTFTWDQHRVRFQDVDHAGIVFFAKYYEYCHEAWEEFLEGALGLELETFFSGEGVGAPLVATASEHHHPLWHGDRLRIQVSLAHLGGKSIKVHYHIENQDGVHCATVETTHVFVVPGEQGRGIQPVPIPEPIRQGLSPFLRQGD